MAETEAIIMAISKLLQFHQMAFKETLREACDSIREVTYRGHSRGAFDRKLHTRDVLLKPRHLPSIAPRHYNGTADSCADFQTVGASKTSYEHLEQSGGCIPDPEARIKEVEHDSKIPYLTESTLHVVASGVERLPRVLPRVLQLVPKLNMTGAGDISTAALHLHSLTDYRSSALRKPHQEDSMTSGTRRGEEEPSAAYTGAKFSQAAEVEMLPSRSEEIASPGDTQVVTELFPKKQQCPLPGRITLTAPGTLLSLAPEFALCRRHNN
ncbi:uncharacterized protein LOC128641211 [Bombina bombina]|uniref:uncharacterized protein LOC128641211 n=1 Tax=Bombina bombina TaxID=8345 RepID=UPI00235A58C5|nr:uncharacterized protein LOC128641211 [Bombina bombina]